MYEYDNSGGAAKALVGFVGVLLVVAVVAGIYLGGSELFSPSTHKARAERLDAEADAIRAQTAYEEEKREIELALAEEKAAAELEALEARHAIRLELMKPLVVVGPVVGSVAILALTVTISYYLIEKAKAARKGQVLEGDQPGHYTAMPTPPNREQGKGSQGRSSSPIDDVRVRPDEVTYDAFLAYFRDYILYPNHPRAYYSTEIAPEIEDVYLMILTGERIITSEANGDLDWLLPSQIRGVEDVRQRISRRAFYGLVSSCFTIDTVEPPVFSGMALQHEPVAAYWSRQSEEYGGHSEG